MNVQESQVIAVVGKMASGKNYISSQLEKEGWASIDADLLVHAAIDQACQTIVQTFQPYAKEADISITKDNGKIDRRALGTILFSHPDLMAKQEAIVYPIITKMIEDFICSHEKVIINATVLFKTPEIMKKCQKILYVKAGLLKRIIRARKRDHLPYKQIFKRFYSQRHLLAEYKKSNIPLEIVKN